MSCDALRLEKSMAYNTGNPLGSSSPKDLFDNSANFDEAMNSVHESFMDRLGRPRFTYQAFHNLVVNAVSQVTPTVDAAKIAVNNARDAGISSINTTVSQSNAAVIAAKNAGLTDIADAVEVVQDASATAETAVSSARDAGLASIGQSVQAVDDAEAVALADMLETAANLGDNLNNKYYRGPTAHADMLADPQTRDAVTGIVDGDEDPLKDGWHAWDLAADDWVRFSDQPVRESQVGYITDVVRPSLIPGVSITFEDLKGSIAALMRNNGLFQFAALDSLQITLAGQESILSSPTPGRVLTLKDALGNVAWQVYKDGTSEFTVVEAQVIRLRGVDIESRIAAAGGAASSSDHVMTEKGLAPMYPVMTKVSGWGSSSLENLTPHLTSLFAELSPAAAYYNGAKGGETSKEIAARLGAIPMLLTLPGNEIPASGSVVVTSSNVSNSPSLKAFTGRLAGVPGTVSHDGTQFIFTRTTDGDSVAISADTPFLPDVGPTYRDGVMILWMGKNDVMRYPVADIISRTNISYDYYSPYVKKVLVIGHFGNTQQYNTVAVDRILQVNAAYAERYGIHYLDALAYLESPQVWTDTGITPNSGDLEMQAGHCLPSSLSPDGQHFNAALNVAFTNYIKAKLQSIGWFA